MDRTHSLPWIAAVIIAYLWTLSTGAGQQHNRSYYNLQTDSLLSGRLDLNIPVDSDKLTDPASGQPNWNYIFNNSISDLSVYRGKVYSYFGLTPVFTLYLPYRILTRGADLYDGLAILFFSAGGLFWSLRILRLLRKKYFPELRPLYFALACGVLTFGGFIPTLLRQHTVYHTAIASCYFFFTGAVYLLLSTLDRPILSWTRFAWTGLFLGLAVGCRPHFFIAAVILLAKLCERLFSKKIKTARPGLIMTLVGGPFLLFVMVWALFNLLRFDSFFETGTRYLTTNPEGTLFHARRILPSMYLLLLRPPALDLHFPFLHAVNTFPAFIKYACPLYAVIENSVGFFLASPFTLLVCLTPLLVLKNQSSGGTGLRHIPAIPTFELNIFLLPSLVNIFLYLMFNGICMRYFADFATPIILSAATAWFWLDISLKRRPVARRLTGLLGFLLGISSIVGGIAWMLDYKGTDYQKFYDCVWCR